MVTARDEHVLLEAERKKHKGAMTGMAHFYRKLLEDSEQKHEEAVAAVTEHKPAIGPQGPSLTITKPADLTTTSDLELARLAREQGKAVELNDDNQIVDKRELLSAGLNLSAPNTRRVGFQTTTGKKSEDNAVPHMHRAVGTAASRREIVTRRTAEINQQMAEEHERQQAEMQRNAEESRQRIVAKRNTEMDLQDAKARYRERKRRKVEEGVTTTGNTGDTS